MANNGEASSGASWEVREFIRAIKAYLRRTQGSVVSITSRKLVRTLGHSLCSQTGTWLRYKFARFLRCLERRHVVRRIGKSTGFVYIAEREKLEKVIGNYLHLAMLIESDMV